jgi:hypothetical protein
LSGAYAIPAACGRFGLGNGWALAIYCSAVPLISALLAAALID